MGCEAHGRSRCAGTWVTLGCSRLARLAPPSIRAMQGRPCRMHALIRHQAPGQPALHPARPNRGVCAAVLACRGCWEQELERMRTLILTTPGTSTAPCLP